MYGIPKNIFLVRTYKNYHKVYRIFQKLTKMGYTDYYRFNDQFVYDEVKKIGGDGQTKNLWKG